MKIKWIEERQGLWGLLSLCIAISIPIILFILNSNNSVESKENKYPSTQEDNNHRTRVTDEDLEFLGIKK